MLKRLTLLLSLLPWLSSCSLVCQPPGDGPMPQGRWAGDAWSITAQVDGTAFVESSCALGSVLEPILVQDGQISFTVTMVPEGVQPSNGSYEATLSGEICGDTLQGEVEIEEVIGPIQAILGDPAQLERCQTTSAPLPSK